MGGNISKRNGMGMYGNAYPRNGPGQSMEVMRVHIIRMHLNGWTKIWKEESGEGGLSCLFGSGAQRGLISYPCSVVRETQVQTNTNPDVLLLPPSHFGFSTPPSPIPHPLFMTDKHNTIGIVVPPLHLSAPTLYIILV